MAEPDDAQPGGDHAVRIGEGEILWLRQTFANQWRREPTPEEMAGLIATLGRGGTHGPRGPCTRARPERHDRPATAGAEDRLHGRRHGKHRGPGRGRTARLLPCPRRAIPHHAKISFSHIYFSRERRRDAETDATEALRLAAGNPAIRPTDGDRLLLDDSYSDLDRHAVESLFGAAFAQAVFALPAGAWRGPVNSGFGVHLVYVTDMRPAQQRSFEEVRATVTSEWLRERSRAMRADYLDRLRAKYGVVIDPSARQVPGGRADAAGGAVNRLESGHAPTGSQVVAGDIRCGAGYLLRRYRFRARGPASLS